MVDHHVGDGPAERNQLDPGERDVSVFGGGDPATSKEFEEMVCKYFVGPTPHLTYILPPMKKLTPLPSTIPFATPCGITPSLSNEQHQYSSPPSLPSFSSPQEHPHQCSLYCHLPPLCHPFVSLPHRLASWTFQPRSCQLCHHQGTQSLLMNPLGLEMYHQIKGPN